MNDPGASNAVKIHSAKVPVFKDSELTMDIQEYAHLIRAESDWRALRWWVFDKDEDFDIYCKMGIDAVHAAGIRDFEFNVRLRYDSSREDQMIRHIDWNGNEWGPWYWRIRRVDGIVNWFESLDGENWDHPAYLVRNSHPPEGARVVTRLELGCSADNRADRPGWDVEYTIYFFKNYEE
jgi:hypothetical protein